jgi:uncharacterized membrane protein YphA (DoxX/SURF4 family)
MKKVNIAYWIITILFSLFMISTSIGDIILDEKTVKFMTVDLKYPLYILPFIGWAKVIGSIVILIPAFPRLKEWAYAGLCIDLAGATYSGIAIMGVTAQGLGFMFIFFAFLFASYFLYHKRMKMKAGM